MVSGTRRDDAPLRLAPHGDDWPSRWRWWVKLSAVALSAVAAALLILFGALRFLDQAQRQHDQVECIRLGVKSQAEGNARMGAVVLDPRATQPQRQAAFVAWSQEQGRIAARIGLC